MFGYKSGFMYMACTVAVYLYVKYDIYLSNKFRLHHAHAFKCLIIKRDHFDIDTYSRPGYLIQFSLH